MWFFLDFFVNWLSRGIWGAFSAVHLPGLHCSLMSRPTTLNLQL